jgi:rhodanese-related sulfurtransferase
MRRNLLAALTMALFVTGTDCAPTPPKTHPEELSPLEAQAWLQASDVPQFIDVRTPEEFSEERIEGAKLIPVQVIADHLSEMDKERPVLLYCRAGSRSRKALDLLKTRGFKRVSQITGGITAWKEQGLPVLAGPLSKP